jgi:hypothetical protein
MDCFVRLKITLTSDSVSDIQKMHELFPDRTWKPGDLRPNTKIIEKNNGCMFLSGLEKEACLEDHLDALLLRTKPIAAAIKEMSRNHIVEIWCAIYTDNSPPLFFDKNVIEDIASLGANFDIDLYLTDKSA